MSKKFCSYCGREIEKRAKICPYCNADQIGAQEVLTEESIRKPALSTAAAAIITFAAVQILAIILIGLSRGYISEEAAAAVLIAKNVVFFDIVLLVIISALVFLFISVFLRKKLYVQLIAAASAAVILSIIGANLLGKGIEADPALTKSSEIFIEYARSLSAGFGAAFPMLIGGLCISGYGRNIKKSLILELVFAGAFLAAVSVFSAVFIPGANPAINGMSTAMLLSGIIVLAISGVSGKGFRELLKLIRHSQS